MSHDEDMERAIAASLQNTSSEQDDDLRRAIEMSLNDQPSVGTSAVPASGPSFISERAQQEQERLARQKRLRPDLHAADAVPSSSKRARTSASSESDSDDGTAKSILSKQANLPLVEDGTFWEGALRQTAVRHAHPRSDGQSVFRLTDVIGDKSKIAFVILSTYALNLPWIYQYFDPTTPVILVMPPNPDGMAKFHYILPNWIRASPPLAGGRGVMHVKLMLLFYRSGRLRVVVSTANLEEHDFRDIENSVWLQDVPRSNNPSADLVKKNAKKSPLDEDFPTTLCRTLKSLQVPRALSLLLGDHPNLPIRSVDDLFTGWDWKKVTALLIPTMSGKHEGWPAVVKQGHPRLMAAIRCLGLEVNKGKGKKVLHGERLQLECQGSSIGQYTTQWFNEFYHSACGKSAEDYLDEPKGRRSKLPYPPIKVVFPSLRTVQQSALGEMGGGTIFCRREQWSATKFPRDHFYDSQSKAGRVLMHSKMIIATISGPSTRVTVDLTNSDSDEDVKMKEVEEEYRGWAYVGSANFTASAWGTISGSAFNPILNVTNYELGIIIPLKSKQEADRVACFQRPSIKYQSSDVPWMQSESLAFAV